MPSARSATPWQQVLARFEEALAEVRGLGDRAMELSVLATRATCAHRGIMTPPMDVLPATLSFEIRRRVGAGGMGIVYEAFDHVRRTRIAVKTLRHADVQHLLRLKNEFRSLQNVEHRNLVRLYELLHEDGRWFVTMEYVDGVDIVSYVRSRPRPAQAYGDTGSPAAFAWLDTSDDAAPAPHLTGSATLPEPEPRFDELEMDPGFDEALLRQSFTQLAGALSALHAAGKVHRDLKPSNVLVDKEGRVVVLDFGLVTEIEPEGAITGDSIVGTAAYMAPEQALSNRVAPAADWYAFGVMLFEALTGRLPIDGGTVLELAIKKQQVRAIRPGDRIEGIPPDLDALCAGLLKTAPEERADGAAVHRVLAEPGDKGGHGAHLMQIIHAAPARTSGTFVGRSAELAALDDALAASRGGTPAWVIVSGESGIGKTELVRQFCAHVRGTWAETVVLRGRCYQREAVPYKAFDGVADELGSYLVGVAREHVRALLPLRADLLPRLFPTLERVECIAEAPRVADDAVDPVELRRRMFGAFRELLSRVSLRAPTVVFVDDIQWADPDGLALFDHVVGAEDPLPILFIATARTEGTGATSDATGALPGCTPPASRRMRHIRLSALPPEDARTLASRLVVHGARAASDIASEAAGHPLFILELARHVGLPGREEGRAVRLDEALQARVASLPREARELLETLAVAGSPLAPTVAAEAVRQGGAEYEKAAAALRVATLAREGGDTRGAAHIEPYHDRVRESVLAMLGDDVRRDHHHRLALALEGAGVGARDPQLLLRHLAAAGETARAAEYAEAAARRAADALAFDQAATLLRTALDLGSHDEDRRRALELELGSALANAGRGVESADTFIAAARGAGRMMRLDCERRAAEQLLMAGHLGRGLEAMGRLLREIGVEMPRTPLRALVALLWHRLRLRLRPLRWRALKESEIPADTLLRMDVLRAAATPLAWVDFVRGSYFHVLYLHAALDAGEPFRTGSGLAVEAGFITSSGRRSPLAARLFEAARRADVLAGGRVAPYIAGAEAADAYMNGHFRLAAGKFRDAIEMTARMPGNRFHLNALRFYRLGVLIRMGAFRDVRREYDEYVTDAARRDDRYTETTIRRVCNIVWLVDDRPEAALHDLDLASWQPAEVQFHVQHWYELRARGEIALYTGRVEEALSRVSSGLARMDASLLTRMRHYRSDARWLHGRLLVALAARRGDARALKRAGALAARVEREGVGLSRVSALLLRAAVWTQMGRRAEAMALLESAQSQASALDMEFCAAAALRRRGELLGRDEGEALVGRADRWMREAGIVDPVRMSEVVAPGFGGGE